MPETAGLQAGHMPETADLQAGHMPESAGLPAEAAGLGRLPGWPVVSCPPLFVLRL